MTPAAPTLITVRQRPITTRGIVAVTLRIYLWRDPRSGSYKLDVYKNAPADLDEDAASEYRLDHDADADALKRTLRTCGERDALIRNACRKVDGAILHHRRQYAAGEI